MRYELNLVETQPTLDDVLQSFGSAGTETAPCGLDVCVSRVFIDVVRRAWNVRVECDSLEDHGLALGYFRTRLHEAMPELRGLELRFQDRHGRTLNSSPGFSGRPQDWLQENWEELIRETMTASAGFASWLASCSWQLVGRELTVTVAHSFGVELLAKKGFAQFLSNLIANCGGPSLDVVVDAGDFDKAIEAMDSQREREEAAYVASLTGARDEGERVARELILGRKISAAPVAMSSIVEDENNVVLLGKVFELDRKTLKNGKTLLTGSLTDMTDSISFKVFGDAAAQVADSLKLGSWLKVKGNVEADRFSAGELVMTLTDINTGADPYARHDVAEEKRVELHLHTKMSAMDSIVETKDIVKLAAKWGHKAIAITDHGVVHDFPAAYAAARDSGIKIIYGVEGYLVDDPKTKEKPYHVVVLAKDRAGLTNLYKLVSEAHIHHFYRHPRFPRQLLEGNREGLIIGSACEAGELFLALLNGASERELERIASFYDYLEIQPIGNNEFLVREGKVASHDELRNLNRRLVELGRRLGKPVVATCDVHFQDPADSAYRHILLASQGFTDADKQAPLYFRTTDEMLAEFSYLGDSEAREVVVTNSNLVADWVENMAPVPSDFAPPIIDGAEEDIRRMSYERAHELYGDPLPEVVRARLELELDSIIGHGYAVLYLIAQKLVSRSVADGYVVGSRGSVGSSFVATMCGITEVNPLPPHYLCPVCRYSEFVEGAVGGTGVDLEPRDCPVCAEPLRGDGQDIYFATFMGFDGDKEPDIDLNFSGEYQSEAHKFVEELFGTEFIFRVGTIATLADKTVYGFVRKFLEAKALTKRSCEINRLIQGCVGVRRSTGQHPGGLVVVPRNRSIYEFTPVQYPANNPDKGKCITHFDFHSALESRLVKLDILGHDDPTMIHRLHQLTGTDPTSVPLNDPKVLSIFSSLDALGVDGKELGVQVGTWGIPEFNTQFTQAMLEVIRPKNFAELIYVSGFSHGTGVWLGNALELLQSKTAQIHEVISVRDCIMTDLIRKGVPSKQAFGVMERVRKGKGLTDDEVDSLRAHQVPEWYIESCRRIQYLFPKAHAVAYVTMAVRIAWFKVYEPEAFYTAYFSIRADDFDANMAVKGYEAVREGIRELGSKGRDASVKEKATLADMQLAMEAQLRGISFLPVDVTLSKASEFDIVEERKLRCPLGSLGGLGGSAANAIVEARRAGPFVSVEDLKLRASVSSAVIDVLRQHGCFEGWTETSQMSLF